MLALAPIIIVEINKQFDKTWKGIRKIRHFLNSFVENFKILKIL